MPVNPQFTAFVVEHLGRIVTGVRSRPMFGGVSISTASGTFALIDEDQLYLKGDKVSRARFEAEGWAPFRPFGEGGSTMAYFAVPGELLEDRDAIEPWVRLALEAASRARTRKKGP